MHREAQKQLSILEKNMKPFSSSVRYLFPQGEETHRQTDKSPTEVTTVVKELEQMQGDGIFWS